MTDHRFYLIATTTLIMSVGVGAAYPRASDRYCRLCGARIPLPLDAVRHEIARRAGSQSQQRQRRRARGLQAFDARAQARREQLLTDRAKRLVLADVG